jgi:hypothetical protein
MILLVAILAGLVVGPLLARIRKRPWMLPPLGKPWLVILACLLQSVSLALPAIWPRAPVGLSAAGLIISLVMLLVFCWLNRQLSGGWLLALGLFFNLLVISANGGFMPISPQTASRLVPAESLAALGNGSRFGYKDILLPPVQTHLVLLSDRFLPPEGFVYQVAFSLGDVLIALGAFWLMVTQGQPLKMGKIRLKNEKIKESKC